MIYEPREDSDLLKKWVQKKVSGKVLDMGTGSGIQAVTALENTPDVLAVDINPECVDFVKNKGINAIQSNLFSNIQGRFDWIIFNPPYLPEDFEEPEDSKLSTTGGADGNEIIIAFLQQAKEYLNPHGKILILISSLTGEAEELFQGYTYTLLEEEKLFFEELFVYELFP
ncbi:methyltransferase domain-containing protein [Candidatus Woesearchaeota archaeon]|nr:methyltransferase domain-containing protein [Candidatus Woesearchaeota archaeon]